MRSYNYNTKFRILRHNPFLEHVIILHHNQFLEHVSYYVRILSFVLVRIVILSFPIIKTSTSRRKLKCYIENDVKIRSSKQTMTMKMTMQEIKNKYYDNDMKVSLRKCLKSYTIMYVSLIFSQVLTFTFVINVFFIKITLLITHIQPYQTRLILHKMYFF